MKDREVKKHQFIVRIFWKFYACPQFLSVLHRNLKNSNTKGILTRWTQIEKTNYCQYKNTRAVRCKPSSLNQARNLKGNFTHPADSAVLLLIAGWSSSFCPRAQKTNLYYSSRRSLSQLQRETLSDEKEKRQIRACPRYNICCDLVFPDRSKINQMDQLYWEWGNVDQILLWCIIVLNIDWLVLLSHTQAVPPYILNILMWQMPYLTNLDIKFSVFLKWITNQKIQWIWIGMSSK